MPGYDIRVLASDGTELPPGSEGALCLRLPLPRARCHPVARRRAVRVVVPVRVSRPLPHRDGGYVDEDGYIFVMGRTDDVINVAGHRLSTGAMEAVLAAHPAVAECAVIGVADELKGHVPRGLVVLKAGAGTEPSAVAAELVAAVRAEIGPVAALRRVDVVAALPKTRSGKILRRTMREIADGGDPPVPSTIEDPTVLERLAPVLRS